MFDKFSVIQPLRKNTYDIKEGLQKYIAGNEDPLLKSQLYLQKDNLTDIFFEILAGYNILKEEKIYQVINLMPVDIANQYIEVIKNIINRDNIYEQVIENVDNYWISYINTKTFLEYIKKYFLNLIKQKEFDIANEKYKIHENINKIKEINIIGLIHKDVIKYIETIENLEDKIESSYYYYLDGSTYIIKQYKKAEKYMDKLLIKIGIWVGEYLKNNINNDFEKVNDILYKISLIDLTTDSKKNISENKKKYIEYIKSNLGNKSMISIIYNFLKYINDIELILELVENKIKNILLSTDYQKSKKLFEYFTNLVTSLKLDCYTYDFTKNVEKFIKMYDIEKYKEKFMKKLIILEQDTIVVKYEDDDIYKNDNNNLTKLMSSLTDQNVYVSKNSSSLIIEVMKDNKLSKHKVNLNQYMILENVLNNNIVDVETLNKGYGKENIKGLMGMDLIKVENSKIVALCS